ncbi:MAG: Arginine-binding extracellular protein ArtP [Chlamydiae bacterium]|nr:Arginine-binding extracellular protein ArtP [Chlamydiota bacterium]
MLTLEGREIVFNMKKIKYLFLICLVLFACSKKHETKSVGIDPVFYQLNMSQMSPYLYGYVFELLQIFSEEEGVLLQKIDVNWDHLLDGLKQKNFTSAISILTPTKENQAHYQFSDPILELGPVLIVKQKSFVKNIHMLKGRIVGVESTNEGIILVQTIPDVIIQTYDRMIQAFEDVYNETIDGAVYNILQAKKINQNLFSNTLQIASDPLTNLAIRLVMLKNTDPEFLEKFNRFLRKMDDSKKLQALKEKWELD